ncbi:MAG: CDP-diacylglycerol--glycerol-3-phosphate 3-phosphatidyltransferase [Rhodospirillales bacterium]|nr:CDP-diacylglycerol--glycerol-3-phosphate 3-phosphatidyltransferase [Alphaproteobacteria bacterium]MCB9987097.1 CDP-diacylglycerol--glycerol-3-phosphate 3-phosphatidyltransferase [Rhodospirillales bacterium]USO08143.1 MAG: CDP-diacylglycerol--glycerol-3-phosphate 3-phosphatidyltransferase [Rhodospirillales bacterium]
MRLNLPNLLTLFRIAIIPVLCALFLMQERWSLWAALGVYTLGAVTDFFDGYLARRWNQMSAFGRFLDPIADKLLVAAMLILIAAFNRLPGIWTIPAIVIMMREMLIAGLREFLGPHRIMLPVSRLAKWKTVFQMFAMGFLIMGRHGDVVLPHTLLIGQVGLTFAAVLTVVTGWDYMRKGLAHIQAMDETGS